MADWLAYVKEAGPFTAPLCLAMSIVIRWLLKQLTLRDVALVEANKDRMELREKRTEDMLLAANEYRAHGEAMRDGMREWKATADVVLNRAAGAG